MGKTGKRKRRLESHLVNQCIEKTSFTLATEASRRAEALSKRTNSRFRSYRCPVCDQFHITGSTRIEELTEEELAAYRAFQQQQGSP